MISPKPTVTFSELTVELDAKYGCNTKRLIGEESPPEPGVTLTCCKVIWLPSHRVMLCWIIN